MKKKSKKIFRIAWKVLIWGFWFAAFPYLIACWTEAEIGPLYFTIDYFVLMCFCSSFEHKKDNNTNGQQTQKPQPQNPQALAEQQRLIEQQQALIQQSAAAGVSIGTSLFFGSK